MAHKLQNQIQFKTYHRCFTVKGLIRSLFQFQFQLVLLDLYYFMYSFYFIFFLFSQGYCTVFNYRAAGIGVRWGVVKLHFWKFLPPATFNNDSLRL